MKIDELYKLGRDVPKEIFLKDKYTWMAFVGLIKAKYLSPNDTFLAKLPIDRFIKRNGECLLIPNYIGNLMLDLDIRPLNNKDSILSFKKYNFPYGIGRLRDNFKYGDPIYLVEGIADYGALKLIKPDLDVLALRTSSIHRDSYEFYASLTNKIVLISDQDPYGKSASSKMARKLKDLGVDVYTIEQFGNMKDTGEVLELLLSYIKQKDQQASKMSKKLKINRIKEYFLENFKKYSNF
jgi:hypothetical protein